MRKDTALESLYKQDLCYISKVQVRAAGSLYLPYAGLADCCLETGKPDPIHSSDGIVSLWMREICMYA